MLLQWSILFVGNIMRGGMIQVLWATLQEGVIINLGTRRERLLTRVEGGWVHLSAFFKFISHIFHLLLFTYTLWSSLFYLFLHVISIGSTVSLFEAPNKHCYAFIICFCDNTSSFRNLVPNVPLIIKRSFNKITQCYIDFEPHNQL